MFPSFVQQTVVKGAHDLGAPESQIRILIGILMQAAGQSGS
jgi:hypothetical protein